MKFFQQNIQNRGPNEEIFGAKLLQVLRQMNSRSEQGVRGSVKQNLTMNASFYLFSNLLALTFFRLYPVLQETRLINSENVHQ